MKLEELQKKYEELGSEITRLKSQNKDKERVKQEIFDFLSDYLDGCETSILPNDIIKYSREGTTLFIQDKKNRCFYINYNKIWLKIRHNYSMDYPEMQAITKEWLKDALDLEGYTTVKYGERRVSLLKDALDLE